MDAHQFDSRVILYVSRMTPRAEGHGPTSWIFTTLLLHFVFLAQLSSASFSFFHSTNGHKQGAAGRDSPKLLSSTVGIKAQDKRKILSSVPPISSTIATNISALNVSVPVLKGNASFKSTTTSEGSKKTFLIDSYASFNVSALRPSAVPQESKVSLNAKDRGRGKNAQSVKSNPITSNTSAPKTQAQEAINAKQSIRETRPSDKHTIVTNISALNSSLTVLEHKFFTNGERFCYIQGVCRVGDGTYLLPAWMEKLSGKITQCGVTNIIYSIHNAASISGKPTMVFKELPRANINISDAYRDVDIIGGEAPRAEQHLLISDLTPLILLADMFMRPSAYKNSIKESCFAESGACNRSKIYPMGLNPALLVDSAVSEVKDFMWPKGVIRLLRNGFGGSLQITDLHDIYGWRFRSHASCFRSLLVTNATVSNFKPSTMPPDNFMFLANSLSRTPITKLMQPDRRRCDLKVLILNRFRKGNILGADLLEKALSVLNKALFREYPNASVQAETIYFQNSSFHEQVAVMQEADIVVAAHSESNANLAFLRPGTSFLELLPFGVKPDSFRSIARAYDVDYRYVHAQPDTELFSRCMIHFNTEAKEQRDVLMWNWNAAAKIFLNTTNNQRRNEQSMYFLPEEGEENEQYSDLRNIKDCANLQRISVNIKDLAKTVMKAAFSRCGIRGEGKQKAVFSQAMLV